MILKKDTLRKRLSSEFEIKELRKLKYFLGIEEIFSWHRSNTFRKRNFYLSTEVYSRPSKGDKNGRL